MYIGVRVKMSNNEGKVQYSYLIMIFFMIVILSFMLFEKNMVINIKDKLDGMIVLAGFSGTQIDCLETFKTINVKKEVSEEKISYDFEEMYKEAFILLEYSKVEEIISQIFDDNMKASKDSMISQSKLNEVIIYNVGEDLKKYIYNGNSVKYEFIENYSNDNYIFSPNGVCIDRTMIYIKLEFLYRGIISSKRKLFYEKCIAIEWQ